MNCDKIDLILYAVTDRTWLNGNSLYNQVEKALQGGATFIQLREKDMDDETFLKEALEIKSLCKKYNVPFVINDNVNVCIKSDADGVHIGQKDMEAGFVRNLINNTGFEPVAKVNGSTYADVTVATKDGNLLVNLVNMAGGHDRRGVRTFTEVPPLCDIEVSIKCDKKPKKITLEPEGKKLKFKWDGKRATVKIDKLHIHSAVKVYNWEE